MKPIFKFTGKEISDKLYDICTRLEAGDLVELEEIESTEEFILGQNMCARGIETIYISGREQLQENIVQIMNNRGSVLINDEGKLTFDGPINKDRRLDIVVGLPASGKSSAVANLISEELHSVLLDNDEVKKYIPDYFDGWGTGIVHMESKKINQKVFDMALKEGKNIVLPKIGGYEGEISRLINKAKENNYTVNIHYVELNRNKAVLRLLNRFIEDGRFIPPSTVYQDDNEIDGNKVKKVFKSIISSGKVDGYSMWNNDVERGSRPILIASHNLSDNFILSAKKPQKNDLQTNNKILNYIEQNFDKRYGTGKAILFRRIEYYSSQNKNIDMSKFNPEDSLERLNLILEIQRNGILIKDINKFTDKEIKELISNTKNRDTETLSEKIERYGAQKEFSDNNEHRDYQIL